MADFESQVLKPVTEFDPADLGARFAEITSSVDTRGLLVARHILGPLERYATSEKAEASITKAQEIHCGGIHEIFVVVGDEGDPEGIATIYPGLELKRLRLPIPLGLLDHQVLTFLADRYRPIKALKNMPWWVDFDYANPNITAWSSIGQEALLAKAYKELDERIDPMHANDAIRPWTIEPRRSPHYIHEAIGSTSLGKVATRRFDDEESRRRLPPRSVLYARLHSEWLSARGRQKELQTGKKSFMTSTNEIGAARWQHGQAEGASKSAE